MCLSSNVRVCRISRVRPGVAPLPYLTHHENSAQSAVTQTLNSKLSGRQGRRRGNPHVSAALSARETSNKSRSWRMNIFIKESRYYSNVFSRQQRPCVNHPKGEGRGIQEVIIYQGREEFAARTRLAAPRKKSSMTKKSQINQSWEPARQQVTNSETCSTVWFHLQNRAINNSTFNLGSDIEAVN